MFKHFILAILVLQCLQLAFSQVERDCRTLRARCDICQRTLQLQPNKQNLKDHVNRQCSASVGRQYVWRNLSHCEIAYYTCRNLNWNCLSLARSAGMQRRLP